MTRIVEAERAFDVELRRHEPLARPRPALLDAADRWAGAVWSRAVDEGPTSLAAAEVERGLRLAARPVFVCGVHRSGTTLVRDLLDSHPSLSVLPSEGAFHTSLRPRIARLRDEDQLSAVGREWLRRLANPRNQPPYWLLGASAGRRSPYVDFARALIAWSAVARARVGGETWPLVAVALAWTTASRGDAAPLDPRWWVEKTPTNEQWLGLLWAEFPQARVVHVLRHPEAVYASRKHLEERATGGFRSARRVLRDLRATCEIAAAHAAGPRARQSAVVRYEDLVDRPAEIMSGLAAFLDIEMRPELLSPTVAGLPASSNSSFQPPAVGRIVGAHEADRADALSARDRERLASAVGQAAARVGYRVTDERPWWRRWPALRRPW